MATDITREQAAAELDRAERAAALVRRQSRWMARYLGVFAAGFGALTLILGLVEPLWLRMTVSGVLWAGLVLGMVLWANRRPATARGAGHRGLWGWIGTCALYGVALFVGTPGHLGEVAFWVPAAVVVAIPLAIAAWQEARR